MTPIGIGIALALFALKMMSNKDVIARTKMLVENIDSRTDLTGSEKTNDVLTEISKFFGDILPIILEVVIKIVVLDMQNKNGTLQTKLKTLGKK